MEWILSSKINKVPTLWVVEYYLIEGNSPIYRKIDQNFKLNRMSSGMEYVHLYSMQIIYNTFIASCKWVRNFCIYGFTIEFFWEQKWTWIISEYIFVQIKLKMLTSTVCRYQMSKYCSCEIATHDKRLKTHHTKHTYAIEFWQSKRAECFKPSDIYKQRAKRPNLC